MSDTLTCPECGKSGLKRLTKHFSQTHGLSKAAVLDKYPGIRLEIPPRPRDINCSSCGTLVSGYSGRAAFVKCEGCRKTPTLRKKGGDTPDRVSCRICGLQRRRLDRHIKAKHNLTREVYIELFPGALIFVPGSMDKSATTRAKQSAAATQRWSSPAEREAQSLRLQESAPWKGVNLSVEHKAAISAGGTGVCHVMTEKGSKIIGDLGRKALIEMRQRPGYSSRLSVSQIKRAKDDPTFGFRVESRRQKSYETRKRNGTLTPQGTGRGITGFRKGIPHYCRSTLEANFTRILLYAGVPFEYEPKVFTLPSGKSYTPDYRLLKPLGDFIPAGWLELKGWRYKDGSLPDGTLEKVQGFEEITGESITVMTMHDELWNHIRNIYKPLVEWETPKRNLRSHPEVFGQPNQGTSK